MCGIAGYYGKKPPDDRAIQECLTSMGNRGPDATGTYTHSFSEDVHVRLLHSRLSIIDLNPRSNQPFLRDHFSMVFNGEIYNYREVRQNLEKEGLNFRTNSDTEVLSACLSEYGIKGLDQCEGMWAFAWYNEKTGILSLSRDRFGEKPLYIWDCGHGVYLGSEMKFIFALAGKHPDVNIAQLYRYMVQGFRVLYKTEECFFKEMRQVPQASVMVLKPHARSETIRYWTPSKIVEQDMTYQEAVEGAGNRMMDSVRIRLRADVPLAFCMSGGVDSNSLISIAKRVYNFDVHGFTFKSADARYDEMDVILQAVDELKVRHTVVHAKTDEFIPRLKKLIKYHDAPIHTITWYANWMLQEAISESGYKISISGIAADEMFSGYFDHHLAYLYDMQTVPDVYEPALKAWQERVQPIVRNHNLRNPFLFINNPQFRGHLIQNESMFAEYLRKDWNEPYMEIQYTDSLLRNRMLNELFQENVPVYTHEGDLNAMYFSVENRSPYLDRRLFEFCFSIPTRYLIREGMAKVILRDAMQGIVPDCVLNNPRKVGFNAPIFAFLDVNNAETKQAMLGDGPVFNHIRKEGIERLVNKPDLTNTESKFLFAFLNTKLFLEAYT